jgi:8-oxo-dGTP pyrophosphatase MutT (NUDIX family)/GNAT superfamily N-acetyltransferase
MPMFSLESFVPHSADFFEAARLYQRVWGKGSGAEVHSNTLEFFHKQALQPDWRAVLAKDHQGIPIGFALGSSAAPGQWWRDQVALHISNTDVLKDCWCLAEIGVLRAHRQRGVASAMLEYLTRDLPHARAALSTQVSNAAARAFYAKHGWHTLVSSMIFAASHEPYTILGRELKRTSDHGMRTRAGGFIWREHQKRLEVLLMRRFKLDRGEYFVIPGGSLERAETPEQGAVRELLEETNVQFSLERKLYESINPLSKRVAHYFQARWLEGEPCLQPGCPELTERQNPDNRYAPTWIPFDRIAQIPLYPTAIRDRLEADLRTAHAQPIRVEEFD